MIKFVKKSKNKKVHLQLFFLFPRNSKHWTQKRKGREYTSQKKNTHSRVSNTKCSELCEWSRLSGTHLTNTKNQNKKENENVSFHKKKKPTKRKNLFHLSEERQDTVQYRPFAGYVRTSSGSLVFGAFLFLLFFSPIFLCSPMNF